MSSRAHHLAVAIAAFGGLVAGVLVGPRLLAAKHDDHRDVHVLATAADGDQKDQDGRRLAALEGRLGRMEAASVLREAEARRAQAAVAAGAERRPPPDMSPEAAKQRFFSQIADRRTQHDNEVVDTVWARTAEPSLHADLEKLAASEGKAAYVVKGVQCKTTSCAAELRFPDYESAGAGATRLLHEMYSQPCGTTVFTPEPANPQAPYTLTFYFECNTRK